eukprot:g61791.t1
MYTLFSGLWRILCTKTYYRILILGVDNAGKTTLLEMLRHRYANGPKPDRVRILPTVGLNIGRLDLPEAKLMIWDLGGQDSLRVLWDKYYAETHAVIYVIDSSDEKRFAEANRELVTLLKHSDLTDAPLLVLANKQDLSDVSSKQLLTSLSLDVKQKWLQGPGGKRLFALLPVSALTGRGVEDAVDWLLEHLPDSARVLQLQHRQAAAR